MHTSETDQRPGWPLKTSQSCCFRSDLLSVISACFSKSEWIILTIICSRDVQAHSSATDMGTSCGVCTLRLPQKVSDSWSCSHRYLFLPEYPISLQELSQCWVPLLPSESNCHMPCFNGQHTILLDSLKLFWKTRYQLFFHDRVK